MKYKLMGLTMLAAILAVLVIGAAERLKKSDVLGARLAQAVMRARASLPRFRDRIEHPQEHDRSFFVRAQFKDKDGRPEYLWIKRVSATATGFSGEVAEQPFFGDLKLDSPVAVPTDRVVDWTIKHDDGSVEGDFTQGLEPGSR
ncbi:MAG TPA: DUF2314 domain-containing protein [Fimbriimonadaceae bacterium]|nr:DUF2314 domain-containing protein [Fimbriimonadaceae bacterium]